MLGFLKHRKECKIWITFSVSFHFPTTHAWLLGSFTAIISCLLFIFGHKKKSHFMHASSNKGFFKYYLFHCFLNQSHIYRESNTVQRQTHASVAPPPRFVLWNAHTLVFFIIITFFTKSTYTRCYTRWSKYHGWWFVRKCCTRQNFWTYLAS